MLLRKGMFTSLRVFMILALILALGVFSGVKPVKAVEAGKADLWIDTDATTGLQKDIDIQIDQDDEFIVELFIEAETATQVNAFDISLNFDKTKLQVVLIIKDLTTLGQDPPPNSVMDNTNGYADYSNGKDAGAGQVDATGIFRVCRIKFKGIAGTASTTISFNAYGLGDGRPTLVALEGNDVLGVAHAATVTIIPGVELLITGIDDPAAAGVASDFTVEVKEGVSRMAGYTGTITFTSVTDTQVVFGGDDIISDQYTFTSTDAGIHTFTDGVTFKTAGVQNQTITATDSVTAGGITKTSTAVTVDPATASKLAFKDPQPASTGTVDVIFTTQPVVQIQDEYGNVRDQDIDEVTLSAVTAADTNVAGTGTLRGDVDVAAQNGVATFSDIGYSKSGEAIRLKATFGTLTAGVSTADITLNPGAATTLTVTGITAGILAGAVSDVTVTANDTYGNIATGYTGTVNFTSTDPSPTLPGDFTFEASDNGTKTFAGGVTLTIVGEQMVTATDNLTGSITGNQTVTVNPAALHHVVVSPSFAELIVTENVTFSALGEDEFDNAITGRAFTWSVDNVSVGTFSTINASAALFIAGEVPGTYTVTATENITSIFAEHWDKILAILFPAVGLPILIARNWGTITKIVSDIWDRVVKTISNSIDWVIDKINDLIDLINNIPGVNIGKIGGGGGSAPKGFAGGGLITQPTLLTRVGQSIPYGIMAERGPERISPMGAGQMMTVILQLDGRQLARTVMPYTVGEIHLKTGIRSF